MGFLPLDLVPCSGLAVCLASVQAGRTSAGVAGLAADGWLGLAELHYFQAEYCI